MRPVILLFFAALVLAACERGPRPGDIFALPEGEQVRVAWLGACNDAPEAAQEAAVHQYHRSRDEYELMALQGRMLDDGSLPHPDLAYVPPIDDGSAGARRCVVVYPVRVPRTDELVMRPQTPVILIVPRDELTRERRVQ